MLWAALLAGIAGYVDAVCFLALGGAFAANMTGNLVRIGITAATGKWAETAWCVSLLLAFLAGISAARLVFRTHGSPRLSLLIEAAMIAVAGTGLLDGAAVPLLAAAMALQNEAVTHGVVAVNVAFVTGDVQKLGEQLVGETMPGRAQGGGERVILAVLSSYALGAAVGTLATRWNAAALFLPAACLVCATLLPIRPSPASAEQH